MGTDQPLNNNSAPTADAAEGGSGKPGEAIEHLISTLESAADRKGFRFIAYEAKGSEETERGFIYQTDIREARRQFAALLAAAEKAGPGPATREIIHTLNWMSEGADSRLSATARFGGVVEHIGVDRIEAAAAECGLDAEAPR